MSIPDGVFLDLDQEEYFAQEALGSSDLIRLHRARHGWWWASRYNPDFVDRPTREKTYGSAMHALILEGIQAYEERFAIAPEKPADALVTIDDVKRALVREGYNVDGRSAWRAADWFDAAEVNIPHIPCWPNMQAKFMRDLEGRESISARDDRMLRIMQRAILADKQLRMLFGADSPVPPLAEVSVFKTLPDGTRRRWRLDRLFPKFTLDLKTLGMVASQGRPLNWAVGELIPRAGYDIQRADYDQGRRVLNKFVADGFQVHGGALDRRNWLKKLVEMSADGGARQSWDWIWLMLQKPDPKGLAPVVFPVYDDARSAFWKSGRNKAQKALAFYRHAKKQFGLHQPWTSVEEVHYTDSDLSPSINIPHWAFDEIPTDPAAYGEDGDAAA